MNNFDKIKEGLNGLSVNDKERLNQIIKGYRETSINDPITAMLYSIDTISNEYTDERKKDFETIYADIQSEHEKQIKHQAADLFTNINYVEWLKNIVKDHGFISTKSSVYPLYELSEDDKNNLSYLSLFYKGVAAYAKDNQIHPFTDGNDSCHYYIKYNDTILRVCVRVVHEEYYCGCDDLNHETYIDFNDLSKYYSFVKNNNDFTRVNKK